jgi:hypothetical protein
MPRIGLCLVLLVVLAACDDRRLRVANADVQKEFSPSQGPLGGGLRLIAATVVEGGGRRGSAKDPPSVVIDISPEFAGGALPGKQSVTWTAPGGSRHDEQWEFETPTNGTRIIAFATDSPSGLRVLANHVYADTELNRAAASKGAVPSYREPPFQLPLFIASLGIAFAAAFLAWFRVKYGVIALGVSIALWLGYETTISTQTNIRVDLVILWPFMLAALISIICATAYGDRRK